MNLEATLNGSNIQSGDKLTNGSNVHSIAKPAECYQMEYWCIFGVDAGFAVLLSSLIFYIFNIKGLYH